MLTVEFLWGLVGGGVRFAQSFSCPTQLQCCGCVTLCCRLGCDDILARKVALPNQQISIKICFPHKFPMQTTGV